jgi:hypothetical protein
MSITCLVMKVICKGPRQRVHFLRLAEQRGYLGIVCMLGRWQCAGYTGQRKAVMQPWKADIWTACTLAETLGQLDSECAYVNI